MNTNAAKDACLAAYRTAIATRRANCQHCDDDGMRLDTAGQPTHERCTHPSSLTPPADRSTEEPT